MKTYKNQILDIIEYARKSISTIKPSEWVEQNRTMTLDVSPIPGKFSYLNSPYAIEIIDQLSPEQRAKIIAVMKGAQIGISTGVIEGGIGWIIAENPGNILFLVGHEDLVSDSTNKVERMIDNSGIRHLIKSSTKRAKNVKSGDTDRLKEFANGYLKIGVANHKMLRQISMQYGFIDDFESMKGASNQSGSTRKLIEQRFAAYADRMKLMYISTPELEDTSNIYPVYLEGDQRKLHVKCPCCSELIMIEWEIPSQLDENVMCGITYETDDKNQLISGSVGYKCYKCHGIFDDSNKMQMLREGKWIPTAIPKNPDTVSFHISSLYAPTYMYGWEHYVRQYLDCFVEGVRDEAQYKTFRTVVLGYPYKNVSSQLKGNELQRNIRPYEVGIVPNKISIKDGNGQIVLITFASDLNGTEDDARLDWEIVGWSESGNRYSIDHGSIGTFVSKGKEKTQDREKWTYKHGVDRSVWDELRKILTTPLLTDDGRKMKIVIAGIDSGYMTNHCYTFLDRFKDVFTVGLKGKNDEKYMYKHADLRTYTRSKERPNDLFLVETTYTKDQFAEASSYQWNESWGSSQPSKFMNFPTPSNGKYLYTNYFSHFEAEEKIADSKGNVIWKKKTQDAQNHLYDVAIYNNVVRDILIDRVFREVKIVNGSWEDYVNLVLKRKK